MIMSLPKAVLRLLQRAVAAIAHRCLSKRPDILMSDDQRRDIGLLDGRRRHSADERRGVSRYPAPFEERRWFL